MAKVCLKGLFWHLHVSECRHILGHVVSLPQLKPPETSQTFSFLTFTVVPLSHKRVKIAQMTPDKPGGFIWSQRSARIKTRSPLNGHMGLGPASLRPPQRALRQFLCFVYLGGTTEQTATVFFSR